MHGWNKVGACLAHVATASRNVNKCESLIQMEACLNQFFFTILFDFLWNKTDVVCDTFHQTLTNFSKLLLVFVPCNCTVKPKLVVNNYGKTLPQIWTYAWRIYPYLAHLNQWMRFITHRCMWQQQKNTVELIMNRNQIQFSHKKYSPQLYLLNSCL